MEEKIILSNSITEVECGFKKLEILKKQGMINKTSTSIWNKLQQVGVLTQALLTCQVLHGRVPGRDEVKS